MIKRKTLAVMLLVAACMGGMGPVTASSHAMADPRMEQAQKEIDKAEQARKMAASVDSEWTTTGALIKKAQLALKEGDYDTAIRLAREAGEEGAIAYEQGASQKELRMPSYLKY